VFRSPSACQPLANPDEGTADSHGFVHQRDAVWLYHVFSLSNRLKRLSLQARTSANFRLDAVLPALPAACAGGVVLCRGPRTL
jgi:hypothetical protein